MLGVGFGMISKRLLFKGNFCVRNAPYTSHDLGNPLKSQQTRLPSMLERRSFIGFDVGSVARKHAPLPMIGASVMIVVAN
jgi:hypothetical protein